MQKNNWPVSIFLWLWVAGISAAYLYQFKAYLTPILKILGAT